MCPASTLNVLLQAQTFWRGQMWPRPTNPGEPTGWIRFDAQGRDDAASFAFAFSTRERI
jgi:hypothetical protein